MLLKLRRVRMIRMRLVKARRERMVAVGGVAVVAGVVDAVAMTISGMCRGFRAKVAMLRR